MAGPIRNLLERRPLRNAVRSLLGLNPRYGSSRIDTMQATDAAQDADLNASPTRMAPRLDVDNAPYQRNTVAQPPVAPSPEARAVSMARSQDGQRRQQAQLQEEGIATPAPKEPNGFGITLPIGQTDAPPVPMLLQQADRMDKLAEESRAKEQRVYASPLMRMPGSIEYTIGESQAKRHGEDAMRYTAAAAGYRSQYEGQTHTDSLAKQRLDSEREIARINKPEDSLTADAANLRQLAQQVGIMPAAQLATDSYFAASQQPAGPADPVYQARLAQNQVMASTYVLSGKVRDALASRQNPFAPGEPVVVELASIAKTQHPDDPAKRQRLISTMISAVQSQTRELHPAQARALNALLYQMIEDQIKTME